MQILKKQKAAVIKMKIHLYFYGTIVDFCEDYVCKKNEAVNKSLYKMYKLLFTASLPLTYLFYEITEIVSIDVKAFFRANAL